jgi:NAD-dependent deacetylase
VEHFLTSTLPQIIVRAAARIQRARYPIAFTGAGISTASGIPDFRSPSSGLWHNTDSFAVASLSGFRSNPAAFYEWVAPLIRRIHDSQPNAAHLALADMEQAGHLRAVLTQNIDLLHSRAGSQTIFELHGHLREATCIRCFQVYPAAPLIEQFLDDLQAPLCPSCGGVLKPNVVLFGEALPERTFMAAREHARKADVVLIVGTSLEVAPACDLPLLAAKNGAHLIVINLETTSADRLAEFVIHENAADVLPHISHALKAQS